MHRRAELGESLFCAALAILRPNDQTTHRCFQAMVLAIVGVAAALISVAIADAPLQLEGATRLDELGQRCRSDRHCYDHVRRNIICVDRQCVCREGYVPAVVDHWVECKPETESGDSCSKQKPCSYYSRTFCLNGTCICGDDMYFSDGRCKKFTAFEKHAEESFHPTSKFNVLAILMIVAVLVVALLFLVNQRNMFFYFPCCMRETTLAALQQTSAASIPTDQHVAPSNIRGVHTSNSQASLNIYQQDKPPSYADTVLNVQYLPSYQEAAASPAAPKPS
uniref:Putative secreted protein n=1 Tax=Amblyomma cajennense TaxID=34607 RepID=A0A023FER0_AMBCJ